MTKLTDAQMEKAFQQFLGINPSAGPRIVSLTQADADFESIPLGQLRQQRAMAEIEKYAIGNGHPDPMEFLFSLAAASPEEYSQMRADRQAILNNSLGL